MDPSVNKQSIVDEKGNPTALILTSRMVFLAKSRHQRKIHMEEIPYQDGEERSRKFGVKTNNHFLTEKKDAEYKL